MCCVVAVTQDPESPAVRGTIFLSYARADRARVKPLAAALAAAGFDVWWDMMIEGGAAFARQIEEQLEIADAVVAVWSRTSVASDWVRDEAGHGRDRKRLVPVLLDPVEPPLGFRQYHAVDLAGWRGNRDAPQMAAVLRAIEGVGGQPVPRRVESAPADPRLSRRTLVLGSAVGVVALAGGGMFVWRSGLLGGISDNSIAVLPFTNLSGDATQAYFSDGLSEEVRSALSRNAMLRVLAPTSSNRFRDRTQDAVAIATQLGVAFLLEGSVRRAGDLVRVDAALIDGKTGFSRWADSFDRKVQDIFAVQTEIATTVSDALIAHIGKTAAGERKTPDRGAGTTDIDAYEAYLRGRELYGRMTDEAVARAALAQFDAAIAADPNYAAAHAARARVLWVIASQFGAASDFGALFAQAVISAQRAVAVAPDLADAQSTLAYMLFQGRLDIRGARAPFERSRLLGAGDASVMGRFALYCAATGRVADAAAAMRRAVALDPLNPLIHRAAGYVQYSAHNYAAALQPLRRALQLDPRMLDAHAYIGDALFAMGRTREAREAYVAEPHDMLRLPGLAIAEHRLGNAAAARAAMQALVGQLGESATYQQAQVLAQWRDREGAIAKLYRARLIGDIGLLFARNDPMLDPLRMDDKFVHLLKDIGFD